MQKFAIIVAGGTGTRMQSEVPKQFMLLKGKPVLMHTIEAFNKYDAHLQLILVLPPDQIQAWNTLCSAHDFNSPKIIAGGSTRFYSVQNGLDSIKDENGLVAIHDGVRPLVSQKVISDTFESAKFQTNGIAAVPLKDSIRKIEGDKNIAQDRSQYWLVQTPQTFDLSLIKSAYKRNYEPFFTDDASVFEANGNAIHLIESDYKNIKLTTPEDFDVANAFLSE